MFITSATKKNFSLDLRSLALFRVLASFLLIIDFLFTRLPYFTLFYTDNGLMTTKESIQLNVSSLNFISSNSGFQMALFILAVFCFLMLLTGYKTRWALLGSWVFLVSFTARNSLIINAGDQVMYLMLFWALYLPLNKCFSIDSALTNDKQKSSSVFSVNSFAFIFQILLIYYFSYTYKTGDIWKNGQAVYNALMVDDLRTTFGDILIAYPNVMELLTYLTLYIEHGVLFIFVLFGFWWPLRITLILLMFGFHLSLELFMHIGLFSWICIVGWSAFLPAEFWEGMKKLLIYKKNPLTVYYDGKCSFCKKSIALIKTFLILPHVSFFEARTNPQALSEMKKQNSWLTFNDKTQWTGRYQAGVTLVSHSPLFFYLTPLLKTQIVSTIGNWLYEKISKNRNKLNNLIPDFRSIKKTPSSCNFSSLLCSMFFILCFVYVLMWNIRTIDFNYYSKYMPPETWNGIGKFLHLSQKWNMFSPTPPLKNSWVVLAAVKVKDNKIEIIDLQRKGQPVTVDKLPDYDKTFPVFRLRSMLKNLTSKYRRYNKNFFTYLCNKWNKKLKNNERIQKIELIHVRQMIPPYGEPLPEPKATSIYHKSCPRIVPRY